MNIEVEIKIEIDDFEKIKAKVSEMGKLIKSIHQIDDYFIPSHRDFFARKSFIKRQKACGKEDSRKNKGEV